MAGGVAGLAAGVALAVAASAAVRSAGEPSSPARFPAAWRRLPATSATTTTTACPARCASASRTTCKLFLAEKRITGVGIEVTDELRLLVAASAVTLTLGWPEAEWDLLTEVLALSRGLRPRLPFGGDDLAGEAHPWGTVILSVPALLESFDYPDDGYHVGLHEFAHLLDVEQTEFDGIPAGLDEPRAASGRPWSRRRWSGCGGAGRSSTSTAPRTRSSSSPWRSRPSSRRRAQLRRRHAELYAILADYFAPGPRGLGRSAAGVG